MLLRGLLRRFSAKASREQNQLKEIEDPIEFDGCNTTYTRMSDDREKNKNWSGLKREGGSLP